MPPNTLVLEDFDTEEADDTEASAEELLEILDERLLSQGNRCA